MKRKEYLDYLLYIGVILPENLEQMKEIIQNKENEKLIENLMGDYLISLNKESLIKLGINIYNKYIKNKQQTICKHLIKVFNIFQNILNKNVEYCFNIWGYKDINNNNIKSSRSYSNDKILKANQYNNITKSSININSKEKTYKEFLERLDKYNTKKEKNKLYKESLKEEEINLLYTFSPDLSLSKTNKLNNNKLNTSKKKNNKEIIEEEKPKRKVDNKRMLKLYNDYQKKIINNKKLKENIDKENGITFSPKLNKDSKYNKNIRDNFFERNDRLLSDKKNFVDGFNLLRDLEMKGLYINKINIDVSKK